MLPSSRENLLSTDDSPLAKDELQVSEIYEQGFFQLSTRRHFIFSQLDKKTDVAIKCEVRQKN